MTWQNYLVLLVIFIVWFLIGFLFIRYRVTRMRSQQDKRDWRLMAYGGGAPIEIKSMTKEKAITVCANNYGKVMYVDEQHGFIFFKPSV